MVNEIEINIESNTQQTIDVDVKEIVDYVDLKNKPKINGVELVGDVTTDDLEIEVDTSNLATKEELADKADKSEIPTVPEVVSAFENDSGYLTEHQDISHLATKEELPTVPTNISAFTNDAGYLTEHQDISGKADKADTYTKAEVDGLIPDVQVNGSSIVKDGVANIPVATSSVLGVVKVSPNQGISAFSQGDLCIVSANENEIKVKTQSYKPIVPKQLDYAVKTSITTNTIALTDEEKADAHEWLGVPEVPTKTSELENDSGFITAEEVPETDLTGYLKNNSTESNSLAVGENATASSTQGTAIGVSATSSHQGATAIGYNSYADSPNSVAVGASSRATATSAIAILGSASTGSVAIGGYSSATDLNSVAIGNSATTSYQKAVVLGSAASVTGNYGIAIGVASKSVASGMALGWQANASGTGSTAIGTGFSSQPTTASGNYSVAIGRGNTASGLSSVALGHGAVATAERCIQIGKGTNNTAHSLAVGFEGSGSYTVLTSDGKLPGERMCFLGTTAPTTSTVGGIGQFYVDTATGTGYMCVGVADGSYTWKQITA